MTVGNSGARMGSQKAINVHTFHRQRCHMTQKLTRVCVCLTCSGPMLAMLPPGPEFMVIWLPIWPMLLELVAMDTLRFMPLPLYMLLLACWLNWGGDCWVNILWREADKCIKMFRLASWNVLEAAAVAEKGESGGTVSKTSANKHRRRVFWEKRMRSCYHWYLRTDLFSHVLFYGI